MTGASRGAGRGIAAVLGESGARVYVTGRSTRAAVPLRMRSDRGLVVSTVAWAFDRYLQNLFYDVAGHPRAQRVGPAIVRMSEGMATELRPPPPFRFPDDPAASRREAAG